MHDHFWSMAGRKDWYEPEPNKFTTLSKFFVDCGRVLYGASWDGLVGKPSELTAKPLREKIAQLAASGELKTYVLDPCNYEFEYISQSHWRNASALGAIFARCQIDRSDPAKVAAGGSLHGCVFVCNDRASEVLSSMGLASSSSQSNIITTDYLSTYIRFLIHLAQSEKIDPKLSAKAVQAKIEDSWELWRKSDPSLANLGSYADLSERQLNSMRVLLRGETERIKRFPGAKKLLEKDSGTKK